MKNDYRNSMGKADIASLTLPELQEYTVELAEKSGVKIEKFRAGQIFAWLTRGVYDFDEMTNLSAKLREVLRSDAYLTLPRVKLEKAVRQILPKALLRLCRHKLHWQHR